MAIDAPTMESSKDPLSSSRQSSIDSSRALAVKSPQYLQLTNPAGTKSEYIRDGWSWGGFSFGVFWLMRHRVWRSILLSLVALIVGGIAMLGAVRYLGSTEIAKTIAGLTLATLGLLHLFLGGRGNLWRQSSLVEHGWTPVRKIFAKNVDEAMEVGESALSELSVQRVAAATKENDPPRPDLPELRPLLKTGEPEIRTVRRPESTDDAASGSEEMGSTNDLLGTNRLRAENTNSPKSRLDDGQTGSGSGDTLTTPVMDTSKASASAASGSGSKPAPFNKDADATEPLSDTSSFDAPAPLQSANETTVKPTHEKSERNLQASASEEFEADAKPTTSSMAASMAASARNSATGTATPSVAPDKSDVDSGDSKKRQRGSSAEDLFEKTLGAPRRRPSLGANTVETKEKPDTSNAEVDGNNAEIDAKPETTRRESTGIGAEAKTQQGLSASSKNIDTPNDNVNPRREQRTDRLRVEPTLRPRDSNTAKADGAGSSMGIGDADSRRRIENENNELFEVAWTEIEKGKMVAALEARALSQHPDNPDQRKALYIRMRVAQLKEEKLLAREEIASQRRRRAQRVAELEREEVYRDFVQIIQPDYAALRTAKPTLANFARSSDSDTDLSLKALNDSVDRIGMTVVFAPMAGYVAEARDGRMLELGNRDQLNEFLLVLMNSDRTIGEHGSNTPPGRDIPPQSPPRPVQT